MSEEGIRHRKKRPCDVEPVFGNLKQNHHFRRFMLRGLKKVRVETGLLALAHNLRKKAAPTGQKTKKPVQKRSQIAKKRLRLPFFRPAALRIAIDHRKTKEYPLPIQTMVRSFSLPVAA